MEKLGPEFRFDYGLFEKKISLISNELKESKFDPETLKEGILSMGYEIEDLKLEKFEGETNFLAVDSSIGNLELRYNALWGLHAITLNATFDREQHPDPLTNGKIWYRDLMYNSYLDLGIFIPYRNIEERSDLIRIKKEFDSLIDSHKELEEGIDFLLIDGSLYTIMRKFNLRRDLRDTDEYHNALNSYNSLLKTGKIVAMVEDSHSTDITRKLGMEFTNLSLFDLILEENQYIAEKKNDIWICHIKLPSKELTYVPSRKSKPLVVRWEFSYTDFRSDLERLAYIWSLEDDIFHPQIYPLRIADYLTRKIRIGGVLKKLAEENDLELRYREGRES